MRRHFDPTKLDPTKLPTEFRGVCWSEGWEFDAPAVIYSPANFACYKAVGSAGEIESMVDDVCMNLSLGLEHNDGGLTGEAKWRNWSLRGFAKRKNARHVVIGVRWTPGKEGAGPDWEIISRSETFGPPAR